MYIYCSIYMYIHTANISCVPYSIHRYVTSSHIYVTSSHICHIITHICHIITYVYHTPYIDMHIHSFIHRYAHIFMHTYPQTEGIARQAPRSQMHERSTVGPAAPPLSSPQA